MTVSNVICDSEFRKFDMGTKIIRRAQVKVGLINLCKCLFSLNTRIYYKFKSGT
jgi:hypothetical protein